MAVSQALGDLDCLARSVFSSAIGAASVNFNYAFTHGPIWHPADQLRFLRMLISDWVGRRVVAFVGLTPLQCTALLRALALPRLADVVQHLPCPGELRVTVRGFLYQIGSLSEREYTEGGETEAVETAGQHRWNVGTYPTTFGPRRRVSAVATFRQRGRTREAEAAYLQLRRVRGQEYTGQQARGVSGEMKKQNEKCSDAFATFETLVEVGQSDLVLPDQ